MTQPSQSALSEQSVDTGKTSTRQDARVGHSVLPGYAQDTTDVYHMEVAESSLLPAYEVQVWMSYMTSPIPWSLPTV